MKLGMITLAYIDSVCRKIRFGPVRAALRQDLIEHLEDAVEHLMEKGLAQDCAEWEATARMGNADVVAKKTNRIYSPLALTVAKYVCLAITCYLGVINLYPYAILEAYLTFSGIWGDAASSVGIIGSADGPTAIYVATSQTSLMTSYDSTALLFLFILFACVTIILFLFPYINRNKH